MINANGMTVMARLKNPKTLLAQFTPSRSYIVFVASGSKAPKIDREQLAAASADAANIW